MRRTDNLDERIKLDLQSSGLGSFKDVPGKITKALLDQGEYLVNEKGLTPEAAAKEVGDIIYNLGLTANKLKETGSFFNMFNSSKSSDLKNQKKGFEKYGFGELFDDMAASELGITPLQAAHVLDPIKNEALNKTLKSLPGRSIVTDVPLKLNEDKLDRIIHQISPKDNLFAIEYALREAGFDINQFKKRLSTLEDERMVSLTDQQRRQHERNITNSYLGDILFQTFERQ